MSRVVVERAGYRLAVDVRGDGTTGSLVLLHGLGATGAQARGLAAAVDDSWRVVTYDARGGGASTPLRSVADASVGEMARDLVAVLDACCNDGPVVLGGISMGAAVVVEAVTLGLDVVPALRALVLVGVSVGRSGIAPAAVELTSWYADRFEQGGFDGLRDASPGDSAFIDSLEQSFEGASLLALWRGFPPSCRGVDLAAVARLDVPVLLLAWPDDPVHSLDVVHEYADALPGAELVVLPSAPADPSLAGVDRYVADFVGRL